MFRLIALIMAILAAGLFASWSSNERTHQELHEVMHAWLRDPHRHIMSIVVTSSAPFEVSAPWTSVRSDRPDHPPPVVKGGYLGVGTLKFVLRSFVALLLSHVVISLMLCSLYQNFGVPKRINNGIGRLFHVWSIVVVRSAWIGSMWPALTLGAWVGWYWILLAPMPQVYSQAHVEPLGVLGIVVGGVTGYIFTVARVIRTTITLCVKGGPSLCIGCGQSLIGVQTNRCPECGRQVKNTDSSRFGLSWFSVRMCDSRWRGILLMTQVFVVLFFLAFPRTLLVCASVVGDRIFQRFVYQVGDPWSYWLLKHIGLGTDGLSSESVIGGGLSK